jgi:hypothetical protein
MGAITVDGPLSERELDEAELAWDRLMADPTKPATRLTAHAQGEQDVLQPYDEAAYISVVSHPWFERVAQQLLRTSDVRLFWGLAPHARRPSPTPHKSAAEQWVQGCHTDIQATASDWEATPRRTRVELWHWLNDVPADRGAMRVLPGSHLPIMQAWDTVRLCAAVHARLREAL